jgi:hypothetical protein
MINRSGFRGDNASDVSEVQGSNLRRRTDFLIEVFLGFPYNFLVIAGSYLD